jgi:membrane protease YdiL (CAAX protease family)
MMARIRQQSIALWQVALALLALPAAFALNRRSLWAHQLFEHNDWTVYVPYCCAIMLLEWSGVLLAVSVMRHIHLRLRDVGLRLSPLAATCGVVALAVLGLAFTIGRDFIPGLRRINMSLADRACFVLVALTAGVGEELIYRGFGIAALSRLGCPGWLAVLSTTAAFALAHVALPMASPLYYALLGLAFSTIYLWRGNLAWAIVAHTLYDLVCILLVV